MSVKHNSTCLLFKKNMYSDCNCIFLLFSPTDYEEGGGEGRNCSSRRLTLYHLHHRFFFLVFRVAADLHHRFFWFFEWQLICQTAVSDLARVSLLLCEYVRRFKSVGCELFESRSHRVPCRNIASRKTRRVELQLGPLFLAVDNTPSS